MILISGATGFVGQYLTNRLIELDIPLAVLYNKVSPLKKWIDMGIPSFKVDIGKPDEFDSISGRFETVIHLAATIPKGIESSTLPFSIKGKNHDNLLGFHKTNVIGTKNILTYCRKEGIKNIIHSSSVSVYNPSTCRRITEKTREEPLTIYAKSKFFSELICKDYIKRYHMNITILRYSSIFGRYQHPHTVLPIFIEKAKKNETITIFGKGKRRQDFIYVKDVVKATILAAKKREKGIFIIGSGVSIDIITLARTIIKILQSSSNIVVDPSIPEDKTNTSYGIEKAQRILGFSPEYTIDKGLKDYLL